ncbi:hypothetical protein PCL_10422 [Purpureocillium lilacinum]|uniref:Uncharacterized protein n=1 Tax=Purpureocillium lilacinum TaxID=33203 RepID=A0A2U3EFV6_PURLI|nr:hypothetical protein PCL_10422 [Purpureocillium lilacinum]
MCNYRRARSWPGEGSRSSERMEDGEKTARPKGSQGIKMTAQRAAGTAAGPIKYSLARKPLLPSGPLGGWLVPQANGGTHACPLVPQVQVRVRRAARERNLRQWRGTHGIAGPLSFFGFVSWCSTTRDQVGVENVDISFRLCLTLLSTHRPEYSIICSKSVCKHGNIYKDAGRSLIMQAPCGVLQYSYAGPQTSSTTASAISPNQGRVLQVQQRIRDGAAAGRNSHLDGGTVCRFRQEFLGPGRASEAHCGGGTVRRLI